MNGIDGSVLTQLGPDIHQGSWQLSHQTDDIIDQLFQSTNSFPVSSLFNNALIFSSQIDATAGW